jgi:hypothetical protein
MCLIPTLYGKASEAATLARDLNVRDSIAAPYHPCHVSCRTDSRIISRIDPLGHPFTCPVFRRDSYGYLLSYMLFGCYIYSVGRY